MKSFVESISLLGRLVPAGILILSATTALTGRAQPFSVDWFTVDGGGGTSSGGNFSVSGTIGQPDAGTLTGGNYALRGGFWGALMPIQVEGAPLLSVTAATGEALISWTPSTPGYVLQYNSDLASTNWVNAVSGSTNPVSIPIIPSIRFFRLHKP